MNQSEFLALLDETQDVGAMVPTLDDYTKALATIHGREGRTAPVVPQPVVRSVDEWWRNSGRAEAGYGVASVSSVAVNSATFGLCSNATYPLRRGQVEPGMTCCPHCGVAEFDGTICHSGHCDKRQARMQVIGCNSMVIY